MEKEIKELRIKIDGLAQLTTSIVFDKDNIKKINTNLLPEGISVEKWTEYANLLGYEFTNKSTYSTQIHKAVDSLYLAKAWLGKMLEELGIESPYKSGYKTKEDIEPTADVSKVEKLNDYGSVSVGSDLLLPNWSQMNHIEKVDLLRDNINRLIKETIEINNLLDNHKYIPTGEFAAARVNTHTHLCEARFWLGWELQKIKENG